MGLESRPLPAGLPAAQSRTHLVSKHVIRLTGAPESCTNGAGCVLVPTLLRAAPCGEAPTTAIHSDCKAEHHA